MIKTITVPARAIGLNNAYSQSSQGRRFLKKECKQFKQLVAQSCKGEFIVDQSSQYVSAEVSFYFSDMLTKEGRPKKRRYDIDGHLKLLMDAICEHYGFDDSLILDLKATKHQGNDCCVVILRAHPLLNQLNSYTH